MKLGFNEATTLENSSLAQDLVLCEKYGFDYIEIRIDKLKEYLIDHSVEELQRFFFENKIKPLAFNALEYFSFQNGTYFNIMKEELRWLAGLADKIGCPYIVVVPSFDVANVAREEIKNESVRKLLELVDCIKDSNLKIGLEFIGYPNCSINTLEQAWEVVETVDDERVGLVIDCFHMYGMNSRVATLKKINPEKIFLLHIDDSEDIIPGAVRDHNRVWPGEGVIDLDEIITTLKSIGYNGAASIELFRPEYWEMSPDKTVRLSKEKMDALIY